MTIIITGFGADELIAFEATVPEARIDMAVRLSHAPDLDHVAALAWPLLREDVAAVLGAAPPGLDYFLEGFV
jgi:hypothetical protein